MIKTHSTDWSLMSRQIREEKVHPVTTPASPEGRRERRRLNGSVCAHRPLRASRDYPMTFS